jgi:transposase
MKATLIRLGIRGFNPKLRHAEQRLETLRTPEGEPIPANTVAELKRDMQRRRFICNQIRSIEQERLERLERTPDTEPHAMVRLLARVTGIGIETDLLVHEVLLRNMRDRRAVARYGGLTDSPDRSGGTNREKGMARSGNARVRRGMIQLTWRFLLFPAISDLSWLNPTPCAIAVYASRPPSPVTTQHSLPSGRCPLLGPVFHRLDRTSLPGALIESPRRRWPTAFPGW